RLAYGILRANGGAEENRSMWTSAPDELPGTGVHEQPSGDVTVVRLRGELPRYRVREDALGLGASLGNARCWVNTRGNNTIENVFSTALGVGIANGIAIRYSGVGHRLVDRYEERAGATRGGVQRGRAPDVQLRPVTPGHFDIHPAYQRRTFELPGRVTAQET